MREMITSRGVTFVKPQLDEKSEQGSIINAVAQLGGQVAVFGTRRMRVCGTCGAPADMATRQTPGIPDLWIALPPSPRVRRDNPDALGETLWFEVKGKGGTLSPEQVEFKYVVERAGGIYLVGGLDAFLDWLRPGGWVR